MSGFLERVIAERRADATAARASDPDPLAGGPGPSVRSLPASWSRTICLTASTISTRPP